MDQPLTATDACGVTNPPATPPDDEAQGILLRYFQIDAKLGKQIALYTAKFPHNVRQMQVDALTKLNITVAEGQPPLTAWVLAMARENGLAEVTPQPQIGGAAAELCPRWLYFLA